MNKAAFYDQTGEPGVLYVAETPVPSPGPGQVVVSVEAAGINPYDDKVRRSEERRRSGGNSDHSRPRRSVLGRLPRSSR